MAHQNDQVTVNGTQLGYSVHRVGPDKPQLVFAHGYAMRSTGRLYAELLDLLAHRFAVYALDLRGHGTSAGAVAGWSFEALADDVVACSRALGLDKPVFVGHSFGAVIGLLAEIRHPGAFSALCLLSPGPADHRRDPVETLDALIEHGRDREMLRDGFRQMFVHQPDEKQELVLDAATVVDADVHRAQKDQDPHFSIDDRLRMLSHRCCSSAGRAIKSSRPKGNTTCAQAAALQGSYLFRRGAHASDRAPGRRGTRSPCLL